jgi:hypothetical protein
VSRLQDPQMWKVKLCATRDEFEKLMHRVCARVHPNLVRINTSSHKQIAFGVSLGLEPTNLSAAVNKVVHNSQG